MTENGSRQAAGTRIVHGDLPITYSPSGLPIRHLVDEQIGSRSIYVGEQWLEPGGQVRLHTHRVEEVLTFLSGTGEATLGSEVVPVGPGVSIHVGAESVHGFRNTGEEILHVMFSFPVSRFAETTLIEPHEAK